jgi:hypothetical protein
MIRRGHDQPERSILFQELQEGVQDSPDLADIVLLGSARAQGIELVKEVHTTGGCHSVENDAQLCCCLTHELADKSIEHDREEWQAELAGKSGCRHRLARAGWPQE